MMKNTSRIARSTHSMTTSDVLSELLRLNTVLGSQTLPHFALFNHSYAIVTKRILRAMEEGYFKEPQLIDAFVVTFVGYYFDALNETSHGTLRSTSPWSKMNEYSCIASAPLFLSLLIGANAHINHDLPIALKEFVNKNSDDHSLTDLAKISKILMQSGIEITDSFDEPHKFYDVLKRRFRFMYYRPAMYTILCWRIVAWRNYRRLRRSDQAMSHISQRSHKIANRLLRIARILS